MTTDLLSSDARVAKEISISFFQMIMPEIKILIPTSLKNRECLCLCMKSSFDLGYRYESLQTATYQTINLFTEMIDQMPLKSDWVLDMNMGKLTMYLKEQSD